MSQNEYVFGVFFFTARIAHIGFEPLICCNVERTEGRFPNWTTISADRASVGKTPFSPFHGTIHTLAIPTPRTFVAASSARLTVQPVAVLLTLPFSRVNPKPI